LTTKAKLTVAFRKLRKDGYFAEHNWTCCQSCGVAAVPDEFEENYVFYHGQDNEDMRETNQTHLNWAGDGSLIRQRCEEAGLCVVWDGTTDQRILVSEKALN